MTASMLLRPSPVQYTSSRWRTRANSSSVSAAPEPKTNASASSQGLPGCTANSRIPATTMPMMPNTAWWMCRPPGVTMLLMCRRDPPRARASLVLRRATENVRMNPISSTNSGRLAGSSTCPGMAARRGDHDTPIIRPDGRRDTSRAGTSAGQDSPARPRQSEEADAEGLAAGDSLGVSEPGGSQSGLDGLVDRVGQQGLAVAGEVHLVGQAQRRVERAVALREQVPDVDVLGAGALSRPASGRSC